MPVRAASGARSGRLVFQPGDDEAAAFQNMGVHRFACAGGVAPLSKWMLYRPAPSSGLPVSSPTFIG